MRALGSLSLKPLPKTSLGMSPSKYQSNSIGASPRPRPTPPSASRGSLPLM